MSSTRVPFADIQRVCATAAAFQKARKTTRVAAAKAFLNAAEAVFDLVDFDATYSQEDRLSIAAMQGAIDAATSDRAKVALAEALDQEIVRIARALLGEATREP